MFDSLFLRLSLMNCWQRCSVRLISILFFVFFPCSKVFLLKDQNFSKQYRQIKQICSFFCCSVFLLTKNLTNEDLLRCSFKIHLKKRCLSIFVSYFLLVTLKRKALGIKINLLLLKGREEKKKKSFHE